MKYRKLLTTALLLGLVVLLLSEYTFGQSVPESVLKARLLNARELVKAGDKEEALKEYLYVFDHGNGTIMVGAQLSLVLGELIELSDTYPNARKELEVRKLSREELLRQNEGGFDVVNELVALNEYLGKPKDSLKIYDELKSMATYSPDILENFRLSLWRELVKEKRYSEVVSEAKENAVWIAVQLAKLEIQKEFGVLKSDSNQSKYESWVREQMIERGGLAYEALMGSNQDELAAKLKERLLKADFSNEVAKVLHEHATRVGTK